jgi:cytochrome bd ubiquinol oxidase subunit II
MLAVLPLVFAVIGLIAYTVLAGADFGAGLWQLTAGSGPKAARLREHAHNAIAPVWEANHVWLIFVLTVVWTAYPLAFGSIASTLVIPLFIAAVGIIARGATYALHAGAATVTERRIIDTLFSASCVLTPFALGTAVGGIASGRVPVGNAAGDELASWLNPTSLMIGVLAVVLSAFLAAVYLTADAARSTQQELETRFRIRALASGLLAGALAVAGLAVLHADSYRLFEGLVTGGGLALVIVSGLAGLTSLGLIWFHHFAAARYTAAAAVAAVVAGWAAAQNPLFLPGLTVTAAAAPRDTLIAVIVIVLAGAVILLPSLGLLFRLALRGRFETPPSDTSPLPAHPTTRRSRSRFGAPARTAIAGLLVGIGLLTIAEAGWAHALGVCSLFLFIISGVWAIAPTELAIHPPARSHTSQNDTGETQPPHG